MVMAVSGQQPLSLVGPARRLRATLSPTVELLHHAPSGLKRALSHRAARHGYNTGMQSLTFLDRADKLKAQPVYVLHGDEPFLKRQAQRRLRALLLGPDEDGLGVSSFDGDK